MTDPIHLLLDRLAQSAGRPLPDADCDRCQYKRWAEPGLHCYMFRDKPGPKCGQFKEPDRD